MFRLRTYQKRFRKASSFNAYSALSGKANGFVLDVLNDTVLVKDTTTAANNFVGTMAEALSAGILVYSSPSTKYVMDSFGVLQSGTSLRSNHNSSGTSLGLLSEPQRTNLRLNSKLLGGTAGSPGTAPTNNTLSQNTGSMTFPDSAIAGAKAVTITTSASRQVLRQTISMAASTTYTWSVWATLVSGSITLGECLIIAGAPTGTSAASFKVDGVAASSGDSLAAGTHLIELSRTTSTTPGSASVDFGCGVSGSTTASVTFDRPQFEAGAFRTSDIPTEGSAVTRAADNLYVDPTKIPPFGGGFTVVGEAEPSPDTGTQTNEIFELRNDGSNSMRLRNNSAGTKALNMYNIVAGVPVVSIVSENNVAASRFRFAAAFSENSFELVTDGVSRGVDNSGTLPTGITNIYIGKNGESSYWAAPIGFLALIPERLSQADMITRTT